MTPCWHSAIAPDYLRGAFRSGWHPCTKVWIGGCRGNVTWRGRGWRETQYVQWVPGSRSWGKNQLWMLEQLKKYGTPCERRNR